MSEKGQKTKTLILEEAYKLFAEKGFKDVTMTDICNRTGLSRGGLYRHYSSTADIFTDIISEEYSFDERIEHRESAAKILKDTLLIIEKEIMEKERSLSLAIYEYASQGNEDFFTVINNKASKRWSKLIEYGIAQGEFKQVDINQVTEVILFYYQGLRMWSRVLKFDSSKAKNYTKTICDILLVR